MRSRRWPLLVALLLSSAASQARADAPATSLARLLLPRQRAHPLADRRGRIPVLVPLPAGVDAGSLGLLAVAPGVGAIRLAPDDVVGFAAAHPELSLFTGPPRQALLDKSKEWTRVESFRAKTGADGTGVIVGIIDTGLDVTHPDFRDKDGKTRIRWMLQAGEPRGLHPELEGLFGCTNPNSSPCAIFSAADIDAMIARDEPGPLRDVTGHGTHVASIAAGNGGPMVSARPRFVGMAPGAMLIVAAPSLPGEGFVDDDLLNAARFIFDRADHLEDLKNEPSRPAVINLSVGSDFGPHDGSSPLEAGLAAMVGDDKPGRAIVVAAGNSGTLYQIGDEGPLGIHTEAHVSSNADLRVPIVAPEVADGQGYVWITFRPGDEVSVGLEAPGGTTWVGMTEPGEEAGYKGDDGKTTGAVINRLVKSPLTPNTNGAVVAWSGAWPAGEFAIHLRGTGDAQLWVTGLGEASSSHGLGLQFARGIKQGTINVPASHPGLLAVGCIVNRIRWLPAGSLTSLELTDLGGQKPEEDSACYFSSAGPTPFGVLKPEISAPGGFVAAAMGRDVDPRQKRGGIFDGPGCPDDDACYVVDNRHAISSGSSMSAPHVAGAIALLFQRDPTLTQAKVTDVLQAGARYPSGAVPLQTQLGPGELDLDGALKALADNEGVPNEPAIERSWYVLSSAYARPDPTWPVWGTVELRRADGTVASGLDGTKLSLSARGGVVLTPLTKVRHGMWRFSVAAPRGSSGTTLSIDVLYDGVSLGARELPVGSDIWLANGDLEATSAGCSCDAAGSERNAPLGQLAAGIAAVGLTRRRRRRG